MWEARHADLLKLHQAAEERQMSLTETAKNVAVSHRESELKVQETATALEKIRREL